MRKKIRQLGIILLSLTLCISTLFSAASASGALQPLSNNVQTAEPISLGATASYTFAEGDYEHYYKFVPDSSGYYEINVDNFIQDETYITVYDSTGKDIDFGEWNQFFNYCKAFPKLTAGITYYIRLGVYIYDEEANQTTKLTVKKHTHTIVEDYVEPAEVDEDFYWSGGRDLSCRYCEFTDYEVFPAVKSISLSNTSYTYDGKVKKPTVTIKTTNGKALSSDYYTVSYASGRKNVGTYKVTIKFKGRYEGSATKTFKIIKATQPMTARAVTKTVKVGAVKKKAQVISGGITVKKAQGKVTYSKVSKGSSGNLSINKTNGKITVKKGTKKGTYKINVKVTAAGNTTHKPGTKTVTVTVKVG